MKPITLLMISATWCSAQTPTTNYPAAQDFEMFNIDHDLSLLPDGHFMGQNWPNGSNTLFFPDLMQGFTFEPTAALETANTGSDAFGTFDCWTFQGELDHSGVDQGITALRHLVDISMTPTDGGFDIGRFEYLFLYYDMPYRGYNYNGVYVYYCRNTPSQGQDTISKNDINLSTYQMDADCGAYKPGYWEWANSVTLFGKTYSGTPVCTGSNQ